MSGSAPYTYLTLDGHLIDLGFDQLQYLYDGSTAILVPIEGADLFEQGCVGALLDQSKAEHPTQSYDISYPYCRTAIRYNMDDIRADPQLGQLIPMAPIIVTRLMLVGCDTSLPVSVSFEVQPPQTKQCAAALYPGYDPTEFYAVIDSEAAELPLRLYFMITNGAGRAKQFWIGVRAARDGLASGAVVPTRSVLEPVMPKPPVNTEAPRIIAPTIIRPGNILSMYNGAWLNDPITFRYRWMADGVTVAIGALPSLVVPDNFIGAMVSAEVTASNEVGAAAAMASNTVGPVQGQSSVLPPVNIDPPSISYSTPVTVGSVLTMLPGGWINDPTEFTYEWRLDAEIVIGATGAIFVVPPEQVGKLVTASVTASNQAGEATIEATNSAGPIDDTPPTEPTDPPLNIILPVISFTAPVRSGDNVSVSAGVWDNVPETFSYQWRLDGNPVAGATAPGFIVPPMSGGKVISVVVTASNSVGSTAVNASNTTMVAPDPTAPVNLLPPVVSPLTNILVGQTLTVTNGSWSGNPTAYLYAWFIDGILVLGATGNNYTVPAAAVGRMVSARVTARNVIGDTVVASNAVGPVQEVPAGIAPSNTTAPLIAYTAPVKPGDTVTINTGAWAGSVPMIFAYAWRLDSVIVPGAISNNFVVPAGSEGKTITATVTATNNFGTAAANSSNSVGPIVNLPINTALPSISPATDLTYNELVICSNGAWLNTPTSFSYQWAYVIQPEEEADSITYEPIPGHTSSQHAISTADHNKVIVCMVRAQNAAGASPWVISNATETINIAPVNVVRPTVTYTGDAEVGTVFTCSNGVWAGAPITSYNYQWRRDDTDIPGATANNYTAVTADIDTILRCRVTANTAVASASVLSQPGVGPIDGEPGPEPESKFVKVYPFIGLSRPASQIVSNPAFSLTKENMYDATMNDQTFDFRNKLYIQHNPGQGGATAVTLRTARSGVVFTGLTVDTENEDYYNMVWRDLHGPIWANDKGFRVKDIVDVVTVEGFTMRGCIDGGGPLNDWPVKGHIHKINGMYALWITDDFVQNDNLRYWEIYNFYVEAHNFWSSRPGNSSPVTPDGHIDIFKHGFVHLNRQWYNYDDSGDPAATNSKYTQDWIRGAGAANYTVNNNKTYKGRAGGGFFKGGPNMKINAEGVLFRADGIPVSGRTQMQFPAGNYKDCALLWLGPGAYPYKDDLPSSGLELFEGISGGQTKDDLYDIWMNQSQIWFNANGNPTRAFRGFPWANK